MSVHPTKTRLALLRDVADGEVFRDRLGDDYISGGRKVNARIAEMAAPDVGWVELVALKYGCRHWQLTDAGRAALDAAS